MDASTLIDPVRIYVLWHSESPDGQPLAEAIYEWFRGSPDDLNEAGYGIPVHYRFAAASENHAAPLTIDTRAADVNIIVPLVDEHMVTDPVWRRYLAELVDQQVQVYPVALHTAAYNLPRPLTQRNFIRVDRPSDPSSWSAKQRLAARSERLLSLLTQACCRLFQAHPLGVPHSGDLQALDDDTCLKDEAGLPVTVFLSHAKADGVPIAAALRNQLLHHGQMQVFFDESDLPFGYDYERRLVDNADASQGHTAAMIAIYTDAYAGRPWCQRELRLAREPMRLDGGNGRSWGNKPLLVLDALEERRTRFLGEIGQASVIRWNKGRASAIVDLLLREILLMLYQQRWARCLELQTGIHAFCGVLDLHVAMQICRKAEEPVSRILVPPPGPSMGDRHLLTELLPNIEVGTFDELEKGFA